jgi:hypothetical protein
VTAVYRDLRLKLLQTVNERTERASAKALELKQRIEAPSPGQVGPDDPRAEEIFARFEIDVLRAHERMQAEMIRAQETALRKLAKLDAQGLGTAMAQTH